jgi:hypothetical protein
MFDCGHLGQQRYWIRIMDRFKHGKSFDAVVVSVIFSLELDVDIKVIPKLE